MICSVYENFDIGLPPSKRTFRLVSNSMKDKKIHVSKYPFQTNNGTNPDRSTTPFYSFVIMLGSGGPVSVPIFPLIGI